MNSPVKRCIVCGKPSIGYGKHFQSRRKVTSYPLCGKHLAELRLAETVQKPVRDLLARFLPVKKGTIPRFKASLKP